MDLLIPARTVRAEKAQRIGLINRCIAADRLHEEVYACARELTTMVSPRSMAAIRRQMYEVPFQTLAEATITADQAMQTSFLSDDFSEGVAHYVEMRAPHFTGT